MRNKNRINESIIGRPKSVSDTELTDKADRDVIDYEKLLKDLIESQIPRDQIGTISGTLKTNEPWNWVDFVQINCEHIPEDKIKECQSKPKWERNFFLKNNRTIEGSLIFSETMSKSRLIRPISRKFLKTLRYYVRDYHNSGKIDHIGVWFANWTKRRGLDDPWCEEVYFDTLDKETQKMIYEYLSKEFEFQNKYQ